MDLKVKAIVLSARKYSVKNDDESVNTGISIQFYPDDNLYPYVEGDFKGQKVLDDSIPMEFDAELKNAPAMYELTFSMKAQKNQRGQSKGQLKVTGLKYLYDCELKPFGQK